MTARAMAITDEAPAKIVSPTRDTGFMRDAAVGFRGACDVVSAMGFLRRDHGRVVVRGGKTTGVLPPRRAGALVPGQRVNQERAWAEPRTFEATSEGSGA